MTIPPRGSMNREWAELYVRCRQLGRVLSKDIRASAWYRWTVAHQWILPVIGGIAVGLVIGLTILGWYEVR